MVLLKGHGPDGFRFFTNYESAKAGQLDGADGRRWSSTGASSTARSGLAAPSSGCPRRTRTSTSRRRPYESQLGAWASPQSAPIGSRDQLEALVDEQRLRHAEGAVPRPEHWGGYLLVPETIEFWQGQVGRLHDRFLYC